MKKFLILTTMFVALATVSFGQVVTGSAHDLSGAVADVDMPGNFAGQVCAACHIPHNSIGGAGAILWSQTIPASAGFQMYTSATYTVAGDLTATGTSLKCLGCHDDATSIHSTGVISAAGFAALGTGNGVTGTDLRSDHPVGVTLTALAGSMKVPTNAKTFAAGGNDYVECGSCHNPHDDTNAGFLITSNDNSDLCLDCHIK
ncbi:MAG: hypothetical protein GQ564_04770 [Bacteroidales bacterium]|nr:hypothetical protein [Bacteroidales bacterium]